MAEPAWYISQPGGGLGLGRRDFPPFYPIIEWGVRGVPPLVAEPAWYILGGKQAWENSLQNVQPLDVLGAKQASERFDHQDTGVPKSLQRVAKLWVDSLLASGTKFTRSLGHFGT